MSMVPAGSWQHQARSPGDGKLLAHPSNTAIKLSPGHHSLPRKKTLPLDAAGRTASNSSSSGASVQQFQRGQPLRRSCLSPTQHHHLHQQQQHQQQQLPHHYPHRQQESSLHFEYFVPRSVSEFNLAAAVTDMAVPPPPPASVLRPSSTIAPPVATAVITTTNQVRLLDSGSGGGCNIATRSREKMVTFEDEGVSCGVTSTPTRKNLPTLDNVFMWPVPQISQMLKCLLLWIGKPRNFHTSNMKRRTMTNHRNVDGYCHLKTIKN